MLTFYFMKINFDSTFVWEYCHTPVDVSSNVFFFFAICVCSLTQSYSTNERFTPTINEEFYPPRYPHSSHIRTYFDDDIRQAPFKRDRGFERIRIPSSTSVNTKSGSVEIGQSSLSSYNNDFRANVWRFSAIWFLVSLSFNM